MKILIADDDEISRLLLAATLQRQGHAVTAVADGDEAWAALQREPFGVLITDYLMPRVDGFALVRRLRARPPGAYLYIILLTTEGGKTNLLSAGEAGVDDFIAKPFDPDLLGARLHVAQRILGLHHHVQRLEGLLPVCAWCKNIRDEGSNWQPIERYLTQRLEARLTHGICPDCLAKLKADADLPSCEPGPFGTTPAESGSHPQAPGPEARE